MLSLHVFIMYTVIVIIEQSGEPHWLTTQSIFSPTMTTQQVTTIHTPSAFFEFVYIMLVSRNHWCLSTIGMVQPLSYLYSTTLKYCDLSCRDEYFMLLIMG